jgi:subtilisin family serine protease
MSFNVTTHFVQQYTTNVQMLLQQKGSKLRNTVSVGSYTGKAAKAVEQIGPVNAQKRTIRHADTPLISTPADARWVFPNDYEWADLIDDQDKLRMLIDPQSAYAQNGAYALGRAMDDEIVTAFFGTSKTGENGSTDTAFATATQEVGQAVGSTGATGLNIAKLREAKRILMANEVDIDNEQLFVVITAQQHDDLLNEAQAISLDYNTRPVLVDGKITAFMGFNFVHCERLPVDGSSYRRVPAYAKSGVHLGMWNDINTQISMRDDKGYATQVYVKGTFGATRTEEKKVVEIKCAE